MRSLRLYCFWCSYPDSPNRVRSTYSAARSCSTYFALSCLLSSSLPILTPPILLLVHCIDSSSIKSAIPITSSHINLLLLDHLSQGLMPTLRLHFLHPSSCLNSCLVVLVVEVRSLLSWFFGVLGCSLPISLPSSHLTPSLNVGQSSSRNKILCHVHHLLHSWSPLPLGSCLLRFGLHIVQPWCRKQKQFARRRSCLDLHLENL